MNLVGEISMYPLQSDYIPPIDDFLAQLNAEPSVEVKTNRMSTQLYGDHDVVMDLLKRTTRISRERFGAVAFTLHGRRAGPGQSLQPGSARGNASQERNRSRRRRLWGSASCCPAPNARSMVTNDISGNAACPQ